MNRRVVGMPARWHGLAQLLVTALLVVAVGYCCLAPVLAYDEAIPAPPGRVGIKINVGITSPPVNPSQPHVRRQVHHTQPVLLRQPNAVTPPPFLQAAETTDQQANADAAAETAAESPDMVAVSYYGEGEGDSNLESGSTLGSAGSSDEQQAAEWDEEASSWTRLDGECWTHTTPTYVFSFCPFRNITQRSTTSSLHVVLGVFDHWLETPAEVPAAPTSATAPVDASASLQPSGLSMVFTDGTECARGKRRSTVVDFVCEPTGFPRIGGVAEPATCEYTLSFHTPLMCPGGTFYAQDDAVDQQQAAQAMQACINLLYVLALRTDARSAHLPVDTITRCAAFLPEQRASFAGQESAPRSTPDASSTPPTSAPSSPTPTPAPASAPTPTPTGGLDTPALVEVAASTPENDAAPIRANIPSSLVADDSAAPAAFPLADTEPLNADFSDAPSSPYADIDDRNQL